MTDIESKAILLVEDEALIAMDIEMILESAGCASVTTATNVASALRKIDEQAFDAALLDLNLNGETTVAVADELARRAIPFLLVTGHETHILPDRLRGRPVLRKPYMPQEIVRRLDAAIRGTGAASS